MFKCEDKLGRQVHISDIAILNGKKYDVSSIFSESEIQIVPIDPADGLVETIDPSEIQIERSPLEELRELKTDEELQEILSHCEEKLAQAETREKKSRKAASPKKVKLNF